MSAFLTIKLVDESKRMKCVGIVTIGRDESNVLNIKDSESSRNHAMIKCLAIEDFYLFDLGSRNGSSINGSRINVPTLLMSGDIITIGVTTIVFEQFVVRSTQQEFSQTSLAETQVTNSSSIDSIVVLVADIRGFTTMSEKLPIKVLSDLMSRWFDDIQQIVEKNHGKVDKFIGDCVLAIWDIKDDGKDKILLTVNTAYEIFQYTWNLYKEFPEVPQGIRLGIGIHAGQAAVGVGLDYTTIGDTVNLAFRLESATKSLKSDLVMSENAYSYLPKKLWQGSLNEIRVKGKKNKVNICSLSLSQCINSAQVFEI